MEDKEGFKLAISELSSKEKDKLIHRLLRRDLDLHQKLYFELVSEDTADQKRDIVEDGIKFILRKYGEKVMHYHYLYTELRTCSGKIAHHVKICSDKFGDIYLNLTLVKETLEILPKYYHKFSVPHLYKVHLYLVNKLYKCIVLSQKLHEDYLIELRDVCENISELITENKQFAVLCYKHQFDLEWLNMENIPEDIAEIFKQTKAAGFLK